MIDKFGYKKVDLLEKSTLKKSYKKKGFSVAEAMVALAIGGVVLGMSAPLISKNIQTQNLGDAQAQVLLQKIADLEAQLNPEGVIRFFYDRACPDGWEPITTKNGGSIDGYYLRLSTDSTDKIGTTIEPSLPNIIAGFPGVGQKAHDGTSKAYTHPSKYWEEDTDKDGFYGAVSVRNSEDQTKYGVKVYNLDTSGRDDYFHFDASRHNNIYGAEESLLGSTASDADKARARSEVRPRSILVSACKKK